MALASLQVCMDSSDWFQGSINDENGGMESSSQSGDILTCSRPLMERKLRPQHDQSLKCPRCDSTHTKFCYYNNYSLSQPRYFCKSCRRYWTKGGTLRNIPVGGGCRKNKKISKKSTNDHHNHLINHNSIGSLANEIIPTDLHLSFPDQVLNALVENPNPRGFEFIGNSKGYDVGGNGDMGFGGFGDMSNGFGSNFGFCSPFGVSMEGNGGNLVMVPYEGNGEYNSIEVKPSSNLLSLDWQDQARKDSYGYNNVNHLGSWNGMMINGYGHGHGSSTTNQLV